MKSVSRLCALTLLVLSIALPRPLYARKSGASLRQAVVSVHPFFDDSVRKLFASISVGLRDLSAKTTNPKMGTLLLALARDYEILAGSPGHGSAWLTRGRDNNWYAVTNRHVAGQADSVKLGWADPPGHHPLSGRVVYVDPVWDLAVILIAQKELPTGIASFELDETAISKLEDLDEVFAVGFPGTPNSAPEQGYSVTDGKINNSLFTVQGKSYIQHGAAIDHGNSGGPLLVADNRAKLGYRVVGINTAYIPRTITNVNLAIPVVHARAAVRAAEDAVLIESQSPRMVSLLKVQAADLAQEFGSESPNEDRLFEAISHSYIAQNPDLFLKMLNDYVSGKMSEAAMKRFERDPLEQARIFAFLHVREWLAPAHVSEVKLTGLVEADLADVSRGKDVRALYTVSGQNREISFVWERGRWRIHNVSRPETDAGDHDPNAGPAAGNGATQDSQQTAAHPPVAAPSPGSGFGAFGQFVFWGSSSALIEKRSSNNDDNSGWAIAIAPHVGFFVSQLVLLEASVGLSYDSKGAGSESSSSFSMGFGVGFNVPVSGRVSILPGLRLERATYTYGDDDYSNLYGSAHMPVLFHLVQHFFVGAGPAVVYDRWHRPDDETDKTWHLRLEGWIGGWL